MSLLLANWYGERCREDTPTVVAPIYQETAQPVARALPRSVRIRPGDSHDDVGAFEVMRRTMGYDMNWDHHCAIREHISSSPNCSFWVAEETSRFGSTRIVGYARSIVREATWMLTEFFVLNSHHQHGIGTELLARCLQHGDEAGATTRMVLASHHFAANALYIRRAGCMPRLPMMLVSGYLDRLAPPESTAPPIWDQAGGDGSNLEPSSPRIAARPVRLTPETLSELNALDRRIVGYSRPEEHSHWAAQMGGEAGASRLFYSSQCGTGGEPELVGYAYMGPHSSGPALAADPEWITALVYYVAQKLRASEGAPRPFNLLGGSSEQFFAVSGANEAALKWLLGSGWQIAFHYLFMSSQPFGRFEGYVGHNPLYLL